MTDSSRATAVWDGYVEPTFGQRFLARLIDSVIVVAVALPIYFVVGQPPVIVGFALVTAYEVAMIATRGQTLGKMAIGTKIVDAATGQIPSLRQAAFRWLVLILGNLVRRMLPGVAGIFSTVYDVIVLLPILKPPYHRGVHDRIAGTVVTATEATL